MAVVKQRLLNQLHNYEPWVHYAGAIPNDVCDGVLDRYAEKIGWTGGTASDTASLDLIRKSHVAWLDKDLVSHPDDLKIWERINEAVADANSHRWRFDVDVFDRELQMARYRVGEHYSWHVDYGNNHSSIRKITVVIQLSPRSTYEEGYLEFRVGSEVERAPRDQGTIILFPSFLQHRVSPVASGERYSLTCWIQGPSFT